MLSALITNSFARRKRQEVHNGLGKQRQTAARLEAFSPAPPDRTTSVDIPWRRPRPAGSRRAGDVIDGTVNDAMQDGGKDSRRASE
jgi:hypothetical protein